MELLRLIYQTLVTDTVDTSASNPCLLTFANRSTGRQTATPPVTLAASTLSSQANAGASSFTPSSASGLMPKQWIWLGGANPEVVQLAPTYVGGATPALTAKTLAQTHASGSLVSALASSIFQQEPRVVIDSPSWYPMITMMAHEYPDPSIKQRAPARLYEAVVTIKVYDAEPSRLLAEQIVDRLDYLLNLGEAGVNAPGPLLGSSNLIYVDALELVQGPEPHFDYSTTVTQHPMTFHAKYTKTYS